MEVNYLKGTRKQKISTQAVKHLTSGQYETLSGQAVTLTRATDVEYDFEAAISDVITDADSDQYYSWIRCTAWLFRSADAFGFEWMLVRQVISQGVFDMNNADTLETFVKDGRILRRGVILQGRPYGGAVRPIKFELFNVKVPAGEELRLVYRPFWNASTDHVEAYRTEYRKLVT